MAKQCTSLFIGISIILLATTSAFAFTVQIRVIRVVSGNTLVTSDDEYIHIVGENSNMLPYIFSCKEPEATEFAESLLLSNRVTMAYRGRHETGVKFGNILVNGRPYPNLLDQKGLIILKSPEAFAEKVAKVWAAPPSIVRKRTNPTRHRTILGEFYRGMGDYMESLQLSSKSPLAKDYNSYVRGLATEYRKVATIADKPSSQFRSSDARALRDSANRVNQSTEQMQERTIREWNQTFGIE